MRTISLRALSRDAPTLTEDVLVLHGRRVVGKFRPFNRDTALTFDLADVWDHLEPVGVLDLGPNVTEATVDDVKKAIEPDKTKESRGRLSKGLGDIPGQTEERSDPQDAVKPTVQRDPSFGHSRPAPKPKK